MGLIIFNSIFIGVGLSVLMMSIYNIYNLYTPRRMYSPPQKEDEDDFDPPHRKFVCIGYDESANTQHELFRYLTVSDAYEILVEAIAQTAEETNKGKYDTVVLFVYEDNNPIGQRILSITNCTKQRLQDRLKELEDENNPSI